LVRSY